MSSEQPIKPRDRLLAVAEAWAAATGRTLGALSAVVVNHGSALERLRDPANAVTDSTLERFAAWLADPANWPANEDGESGVPQEARELAHAVGVSASAVVASAGKADEISQEKAA